MAYLTGFADTLRIVFVPVLLLFLATASAAVMAYGTNAVWGQYQHGFEFILFARRFQWPMATLSLLLCLVMLGMVIAGRKRAWWLIGLGPVLALFAHRFLLDPSNAYVVVEDPRFVAAAEANFVADDDWVVGISFADEEYAYPYAALFGAPVVIQADHEKRVALIWSAYANRAVAVQISRELRAADLDIVSSPANALLLYNTRLGQFINGVTALTPAGAKPEGFREQIPVTKSTWKTWRGKHPETKVLAPIAASYASAPRAAIRPTNPMPRIVSDLPPESRVILVGTNDPIAVRNEQVPAAGKPLNLKAGDVPFLLFRDPADGTLRAFERRVDDLRPRFRLNTDRRRPKPFLIDEDTDTGWDATGKAIDGPAIMRGKRLPAVVAEDGLYWEVMKHWYPSLQLVTPDDGGVDNGSPKRGT